jgi:ABC-type cobalamin/Fe3+-siderophores transport system ATPase subunit
MALFTRRIRPGGLHLLDEPEAPLSPKRQIALLDSIIRAAKTGAQFIIATHSPILLACPGARIYSFDAIPILEVEYGDLEHVSVTRELLNDPEKFVGKWNDLTGDNARAHATATSGQAITQSEYMATIKRAQTAAVHGPEALDPLPAQIG